MLSKSKVEGKSRKELQPSLQILKRKAMTGKEKVLCLRHKLQQPVLDEVGGKDGV